MFQLGYPGPSGSNLLYIDCGRSQAVKCSVHIQILGLKPCVCYSHIPDEKRQGLLENVSCLPSPLRIVAAQYPMHNMCEHNGHHGVNAMDLW